MSRTESLHHFLTAWRAVRPVSLSPAERLRRFVTARHALPRRVPPAPRPLHRDAARLATCTLQLRSAQARERASGSRFNVWRMAGIDHNELRNAAILARLLDPRGDHGLGSIPLQGLFDVLGDHVPPLSGQQLAQCRIHLEERPLGSDRDRIDLVVDHPALLLVVEVKIDALEGPDQLPRYLEAAAALAGFVGRPCWRVVYLTPDRRRAPPEVVTLTWRILAGAIARRLQVLPTPAEVRKPIADLLDHFATL